MKPPLVMILEGLAMLCDGVTQKVDIAEQTERDIFIVAIQDAASALWHGARTLERREREP